ncbi:glycosyl transferase [Flexivirga endophytica]|uniref:Glycosyl transferase n=1 Tax=Flexivirga endophytica TaxID=1849103 RepID=A0A916TAU1_9MICO|nr:glycosyltransferase family 4 protein [Flexivirga endophytica]GGB38131.1 glycosyl transferase [Flexivirga endophytica]GHB46084.1 glycosyl transferase [Flexivirga endophytica]
MVDGRRPRVLLVNHTARLGGNELGVARLIPLLADEFDVQALLFEDGDLGRVLREQGVEVHVRPMRSDIVRIDRHSAAGMRAAARVGPATASYAARLLPWLRNQHVDLLWANTFKAMAIATPAAKLLRIPALWHLHDRVAAEYLPRRIVGPMRAAFRHVPAAVVANSRATADTAGCGSAPTVVYPGLVPEKIRVRSELPDGPPVIGMIGRISPTKGQLVLIRALPDVLRRHPTARVRIVGGALFGEKSYEAEARAEAERLGVDHAITWVGHQPDTRAELDLLTVAVHAATVPEPFGQVITEAMARCVPIVATRGGGATEIVEPSPDSRRGQLVEPGGVAELRDALLRVLRDPMAAQRLATRVQPEVVDTYSIARSAESMRLVWRAISCSARPPRICRPIGR